MPDLGTLALFAAAALALCATPGPDMLFVASSSAVADAEPLSMPPALRSNKPITPASTQAHNAARSPCSAQAAPSGATANSP